LLVPPEPHQVVKERFPYIARCCALATPIAQRLRRQTASVRCQTGKAFLNLRISPSRSLRVCDMVGTSKQDARDGGDGVGSMR
jgi:hypothetical protein